MYRLHPPLHPCTDAVPSMYRLHPPLHPRTDPVPFTTIVLRYAPQDHVPSLQLYLLQIRMVIFVGRLSTCYISCNTHYSITHYSGCRHLSTSVSAPVCAGTFTIGRSGSVANRCLMRRASRMQYAQSSMQVDQLSAAIITAIDRNFDCDRCEFWLWQRVRVTAD